MKTKPLAIFLLLIVLFMFLVSCGSGTPAVSDTAATEAETGPMTINLADYRIIRPENGDVTETNAALFLKSTIKEAVNLDIAIATDWNGNGTVDNGAKEILVGCTNRSETAATLDGLTRKDYAIIITGSKVVIVGGSPEATYSAAEYFGANYILYENGSAILKIKENYIMKYNYTYSEFDIRVASLNVRTASNAQMNMQAEREPRIASFVSTYQPYSIGFQECEIFWRMRLDKVLTGYERAQEITTVTKNYIYYRTDKLKVIENGVFWLSETPGTSSKGFGSKYYISCCWAIFESLENGSRYVHMNTHLDVDSAKIRESELTVLLPRAQEFMDQGYAVVLTGDFNSEENSAIYKSVIAAGLENSRYLAPETSSLPTFNGFIDDVSKYRGPIDFIFINSEIKATRYFVLDKQDGGFMSDHNALYADITIYPR